MLRPRTLVAARLLLPWATYAAPAAAEAVESAQSDAAGASVEEIPTEDRGVSKERPRKTLRNCSAWRPGDGPWHFEAMFGAATLVGYAGFAIGYNLDKHFEIGAGIGVNALGAMGGPYTRLRPLVAFTRGGRLHALSLDTGISIGQYQDYFDDNGRFESDHAMWLQLEISWETWSVGGFTARFGGGLATMLNPGSIECRADPGDMRDCGRHSPQDWPVLTIGLGHKF